MHPSWTPGFTVRAIDTLGTPGKIGDILGAATERRLKREYDKAVAARAKEDPACAELARFDPSMWYIERRTSKWIVSGWADTHRTCGYGLDYTMDADLSAVTGRAPSARAVRRSPAEHDRLTTNVETMELDTHVSPDGRWMLRRAGSDLSVAAAPIANRLRSSRLEQARRSLWSNGPPARTWRGGPQKLNARGDWRRVLQLSGETDLISPSLKLTRKAE